MSSARPSRGALSALGTLFTPFIVLSPAAAQQTAAGATPLAPVVITATRFAQPVDRVLADIRVIDAATIADAGSASLPELLQRYGGVEIASTGGPGQVSSVFLRGSNANHVVVLIDGVRWQSATTGTSALEHIPLAQIDRVEILRGPASSLYGADAIGGVIQIFTRHRDSAVDAQAGIGSYHTADLAAGFDRRFGETRVGVTAAWRHSGGFSATNESNALSFDPDDDGYRNRSLGFHADHEWASGQWLALRGLHTDADTQFDAGPGTDDRNRQRISTLTLESRNRLSDAWTSTLHVARTSDHLNSTGAFPSAFDTDQDQAGWQNDLKVPGGTLAAGLEWRRDKVGGTTAYTVTSRSVRSAYGSYDGEFGAHGVQASLRHDANSQFGSRSTGTVGYGYRVTPAWRISATAGTAFKAPSFNDLYFPLSFGFSGNPELKPERSRSASLAARYADGPASAGLTLFQNRIRDLIAVDSTFTTVVNLSQARIRGATVDGAWSMGDWRLRGEWTLQQALNQDTDARLPRRARHYGSASLGRTIGPWSGSVELVAAGSRFDDVANSPDSLMGGYALVNLQVSRDLGSGWQASARLDNATDKSYELVRGYNTAGRSLFVALKYATP